MDEVVSTAISQDLLRSCQFYAELSILLWHWEREPRQEAFSRSGATPAGSNLVDLSIAIARLFAVDLVLAAAVFSCSRLYITGNGLPPNSAVRIA